MTNALATTLYTAALLAQTYVVSIHLPARIDRVLGAARPNGYITRNRVVTVFAVVPALLAVLGDLEQAPVPTLLATGLFFFLQIAAVFHPRQVRRMFGDALETGAAGIMRLSRWLVFIAIVAYVAYLIVATLQNGIGSSALSGILTLANATFAFIAGSQFLRLRSDTSEGAPARRDEAIRSTGILAIISIGLSVYFFGKDVLQGLDLTELRPLMMSVFLQALAFLAVSTQLGPKRATAMQTPGHAPERLGHGPKRPFSGH